MNITVNGEPRSLSDATTVLALIESYGLSPKTVIVELSGALLNRERYGEQVLQAGDTVELIQFVGGG